MKKIERIIAMLLVMALVTTLIPANAQAKTISSKNAVKSVTITKPTTTTLVLKKGSTYKIKTSVKVTGAVSKKLDYKSSNPKVAKISSNGKITALKTGTTKITVTSKTNKAKTDKITVKVGTPVKSLKLNKETVTGEEGTTATLKTTVSPSKATLKTVTYKSSDPKVAKVSAKGKITLVKEGTAKITAMAKDGSGKKAVCKVTVTAKEQSTSQPAATTTQVSTATPATTQTPAVTTQAPAATTQAPATTQEPAAPVTTYTQEDLVWEDNFDGETLNMDDWNYETHEPGWVNNELQAYTDSEENVYLENGNLVLRALKDDSGDETSYTSGKVTTQGKHSYKYGRFEMRAKVSESQGFLPAYWMMPENENLYGQWPKCGEIDIMEVVGGAPNKAYGTLHYGSPHEEKQGSYVTTGANFAEEFHTYACEWEPGEFRFYVDGNLYHTVNDWFTAAEGEEELTYPAPFDQPFYLQLNLAVGGNWPGSPEESNTFENEKFEIDYVKVYQKDSYDENVEKPVNDVTLRDPDTTGNYVNNGDFKEDDDLSGAKDWQFMTAFSGEAEAEIAEEELVVTTTNAGTVDYSVQLVQAGIPLEKNGIYKVSFDAKATEARSMIADISGPDKGYKRYWNDTKVELTTELQSYEYTFTMKSSSDANGRLEFNLGNQNSTAQVTMDNIRIERIGTNEAEEEKGILSDGNHVYNGGFDKGSNRLSSWIVENKCDGADVSVTNEANVRKLKVTVPSTVTAEDDIVLTQKDLALIAEKEYAMSFEVDSDVAKTLTVQVAGETYEKELVAGNQTVSFKFKTAETLTDKDVVFYLGTAGTMYIDNVRIVEDSLIKNGDFSAGFAGYEPFKDGSADATYVVDSITEDNAADFTIKDTGDADWKIQLKQNNVEMEYGQWYRLSFDAKSNLDRKIMYAIQRDGSSDDNWTPYVQKTIALSSDYETFTIDFQMKEATDLKSILTYSMGAVDGERITTSHRVCIDNIALEKIEAPDQTGEEMLTNSDFSDGENGWTCAVTAPGEADYTVSSNSISFDIKNVGTEDWNTQLKQENLVLEKGCSYQLTFKATSTETRTIKTAFLSTTYAWYGGADITLNANETKDVDVTFTMNDETDLATTLVISMGKIAEEDTPCSQITLSDFSLKKVTE